MFEKLLGGVFSIAWCNGLEDAVVHRIARIMSSPIPIGVNGNPSWMSIGAATY
jgi:hypothetical protein